MTKEELITYDLENKFEIIFTDYLLKFLCENPRCDFKISTFVEKHNIDKYRTSIFIENFEYYKVSIREIIFENEENIISANTRIKKFKREVIKNIDATKEIFLSECTEDDFDYFKDKYKNLEFVNDKLEYLFEIKILKNYQ